LEPWSVSDPADSGRMVVNETRLAQKAYNVDALILKGAEGKAELVSTYRAMLHIDMLPEVQGKGWGRKLIESFVQSVRDAATETDGDGKPLYNPGKGIQIGVSGENTKVVPFYEKVGFRVYPGGDKEGGNVWMVRDL
jgi:GNAT superfamily N-acetyltransferase